MISLTNNEAKVLDYLIRNFNEKNSINELARKLEITHTGMHKILKKLEKQKIVYSEKIGNALFYRVNYEEETAVKLAEFVLVQNELNKYSKVQAEDLKQLKDTALACLLFGSVLKKGREARDIDVMLVIEKNNFSIVNKKLNAIRKLKPKKIHDLLMTREDLNEKINDKVISDILKTGEVLWGSEVIVEAIKNVAA